MFNFFKSREWALWAYGGSLAILFTLWYQVQLDVKINDWFGTFYDMIGEALSGDRTVTLGE